MVENSGVKICCIFNTKACSLFVIMLILFLMCSLVFITQFGFVSFQIFQEFEPIFILNDQVTNECNDVDCSEIKSPIFLKETSSLRSVHNLFLNGSYHLMIDMCKRRERNLRKWKKEGNRRMNRKIKLFWEKERFRWFYNPEIFENSLSSCSVRCQMTMQRSNADVIILDTNPSFIKKDTKDYILNNVLQDQKTAILTLESGMYYPVKRPFGIDWILTNEIDYIINFSPFSDIPVYYDSFYGNINLFEKEIEIFNPKTFRRNLLENIRMKKKDILITTFISNGFPMVAWRNAFVREMEDYIDFHHYGKCTAFKGKRVSEFTDNRRSVEDIGPKGRSYVKKIKAIQKYKFSLAMENVNYPNYFSEKLKHVLLSLYTIPVYYGPSNLMDFFPVELRKYKLFINPIDFDTTKDLVEYLLYLDKNETAYLEYFRWRFDGHDINEIDNIITLDRELNNKKGENLSFLCRLCEHELFGIRKCHFDNYPKNTTLEFT